MTRSLLFIVVCITTIAWATIGTSELFAQEFISHSVKNGNSVTIGNRKTSVLSSFSVDTTVHHYEYVFPQGWMYVYDMDSDWALIKQVSVPTNSRTTGLTVNPADGMIYISYGGDGGNNGNGSLLQYNLMNDSVGWVKHYTHGTDSHAMSPDGTTIYMPTGEVSNDGKWYVINTSDGSEKGVINTPGLGPHNTIISPDGEHLYMGCRDINNVGHDSFYVASTSTYQITKSIGPFIGGIRPFTINGTETFAFVTIAYWMGFDVLNLTTKQIAYTVDLTALGYPKINCGSCATTNHGISLSPDEKELYVIDSPNQFIHVFDVDSIAQGIAPALLANIELIHPLTGSDSGCDYDCPRSGWLHHSIDGQFVLVGETGDVINTSTRTIVAYLPALRHTKESVEIDWQNGHPIATSNRYGVGGITNSSPLPPNLIAPQNNDSGILSPAAFSWTVSTGATSYRLQVATDSLYAGKVVDDSTVSSTIKLVTSLSGNTTYYWRVCGLNLIGQGNWSATQEFTTDPSLAVQLLSFTANVFESGMVQLEWETLSEENNYGFEVQKRDTLSTSFQTIVNSFVPGHGTTMEPQSYSFTDSNITNGRWYYRLKQIDLNGLVHYSSVVTVNFLTGVSEHTFAESYALEQNHPNPFNPSTTFKYQLPLDSKVKLTIFNVLGQIVATIVDEVEQTGSYSKRWDATDSAIPSGVYFYRLEAFNISDPAKSFIQVKKMLLLK